jgi:hypothetical protein
MKFIFAKNSDITNLEIGDTLFCCDKFSKKKYILQLCVIKNTTCENSLSLYYRFKVLLTEKAYKKLPSNHFAVIISRQKN